MRIIRLVFVSSLALSTGAAQASESEDWSTLGRILSLAQGFIEIAAQSPDDPKRMEKHVDNLLSGRNADANKLFEDSFADMPGEQRGQVLGLARQIVTLGKRQAQIDRRQGEEFAAIQARKDLSAMGLSYFDRQQFLDAVKRNDVLAVRLYLTGRGVDPRGALEIARIAGLRDMERVLAEALN